MYVYIYVHIQLVFKRPHGFISQSLRWNQEATAVKLREKGEAAQEVTRSLAAAKEISAALAWTLVSMIIRVEVYFKLLCLITVSRWPAKGRLYVRCPGEDKRVKD